MNKIKSNLLASSLLLLVVSPTVALADSVGGCGLGTKIFHGQSGIAPQSLAITTNSFYGTNTFGITFGTLGCEQNGVVRSNWKVAKYIDDNMNRLVRDMSVGEGESLESLAALLNVSETNKPVFKQVLKENFASIVTGPETSSEEVVASLKEVLSSNDTLKEYTTTF